VQHQSQPKALQNFVEIQRKMTTYVRKYLCTQIPMYANTYVRQYLCTQIPMYANTYVLPMYANKLSYLKNYTF
jgi:hypothetical protein